MIVDPIIREIACSTAFAVVNTRLLTGDVRTPALEPENSELVNPKYVVAMRVRETDDAQPRFEKVTSHGK